MMNASIPLLLLNHHGRETMLDTGPFGGESISTVPSWFIPWRQGIFFVVSME